MPSKKKKYNARFPAGRIKKIMQTDEEVGKVAQAVPVIISRTLELFVESLLKKAMQITSAKNAKTLTPSHMKQCILSESRFDFLKDLVKGIPDVSSTDDEPGTPLGNISPMPLSSKSHSGFSGFHFGQTSDSSSSKSSIATSHPNPVSQIPQPKFYNEIPIGSEENKTEQLNTPAVCRTPVIQHTGSQKVNHCSSTAATNSENEISKTGIHKTPQLNELKLPNSVKPKKKVSSDEEEEEEDEEVESETGENGFHTKAIVTKTCIIDEDYDT